jgi:hypothetical protein
MLTRQGKGTNINTVSLPCRPSASDWPLEKPSQEPKDKGAMDTIQMGQATGQKGGQGELEEELGVASALPCSVLPARANQGA